MNSEPIQAKSWTILLRATSMCKRLLWLRDSDSPARLTTKIQEPLQDALNTVVLLPGAIPALGKKLCAIYRRALDKDKPLVGVGAEPTSGRLGHRTAKEGLLPVLETARKYQAEFVAHTEKLCNDPSTEWPALFDLARKFIAALDWEEFVLENPRGQAACLVLECVELLEAAEGGDAEKIAEETGDVFYNLMAFSLSVRIDSKYMALTMVSS